MKKRDGKVTNFMNFVERGVHGRIIVWDGKDPWLQCGIRLRGGQVFLVTPLPRDGVETVEFKVLALGNQEGESRDVTLALDADVIPGVEWFTVSQRLHLDRALSAHVKETRVDMDEWQLVEDIKRGFVGILASLLRLEDSEAPPH